MEQAVLPSGTLTPSNQTKVWIFTTTKTSDVVYVEGVWEQDAGEYLDRSEREEQEGGKSYVIDKRAFHQKLLWLAN